MTEPWSDRDTQYWLGAKRNWQRWGPDDELGTVNLINDAKRVAAAALVREGRSVSLSRVLPTEPSVDTPRPAHHFMYEIEDWGSAGAVTDHVGVSFHGFTTTHIDAICHVWGPDGMWNGKHPGEVITARGVDYAHVDKLRDGIITRGVLLDVPRYRGTAYVTREDPVTSTELEQVAASQNTPIAPGDALVINCGREAWEAEYDSWCTRTVLRDAEGNQEVRMLHAGFHVSCLRFFRESDCSVVVWDMQDEWTEAPGTGLSVHNAIWAYGLTLVDNAQLDRLAATCRELDRYEFLFVAGPLRIAGGTGSPVNPLAIF